jgi:uncharacterized iron-regulated protein
MAVQAIPAQRNKALSGADIVLLGEQHDAEDHHRIELETVQFLVREDRLATLALEMAEEGTTTVALPREADESAVRKALQWNDKSWPWTDYGPAVMAAVRAGVPVVGANLPHVHMRDAVADVSLDAQLSPDALTQLRTAIREGHCRLLPEAQTTPMTRIQIARDRAMGHRLAESARSGKTVLLVTGAGHADKRTGIVQYLPANLRTRAVLLHAGEAPPADAAAAYDAVWLTPALAPRDHCAELRR